MLNFAGMNIAQVNRYMKGFSKIIKWGESRQFMYNRYSKRSKWKCGILSFCLFVAIFFSSTRSPFGEDVPPLPIEDNKFGERCPPGFCQMPQGFLMSQRDMAFGVHFIDDKRGWIVGNCGLALMTPDGGISWEKINIANQNFKDIYFVGENGWIVGDGGLILHTSDGGINWTRQQSNIKNPLTSVFFLDKENGFAVGTDGMILTTSDGGASWKAIDIDWTSIISEELISNGIICINLYDVFFSNKLCGWIVGDCGTVLKSVDGGETWDVSQMGLLPPLFSVCFKNDREGWAVGQNGYFLKTEDGGKTWQKVPRIVEKSLYKIGMNGNYGIIVGDNGVISKTNDGGSTWVPISLDLKRPYPWLADAFILPSDSFAHVYIVGKSVVLLTRINGR